MQLAYAGSGALARAVVRAASRFLSVLRVWMGRALTGATEALDPASLATISLGVRASGARDREMRSSHFHNAVTRPARNDHIPQSWIPAHRTSMCWPG